jgi:hypothetical protein
MADAILNIKKIEGRECQMKLFKDNETEIQYTENLYFVKTRAKQ